MNLIWSSSKTRRLQLRVVSFLTENVLICMGTGYNVHESLDEGSIITTRKRVFGVIVLQDEEALVDMSCPALSDEIVESETLALGLPPL
jgi:hypothetical protein